MRFVIAWLKASIATGDAVNRSTKSTDGDVVTLGVALFVGLGSVPPGIAGLVGLVHFLSALCFALECITGFLEPFLDLKLVGGLLEEIARFFILRVVGSKAEPPR